MKVYGIIPARGGSKGIPSKNLIPIGDHSLIAQCVMTAMDTYLLTDIFVSTDNEAIAEEAQRSGATVLDRPKSLAGDDVTSEAVLCNAISQVGEIPDIVVLLQCTSPFLHSYDIDGTVRMVAEDGYDCAFTAVAFHGCLWDKFNIPLGQSVGVARQPRQKKAPLFLETGGCYVMKGPHFMNHENRFFGMVGRYEVPKCRSIEIDDVTDYKMAQGLI